MDTGGGGRDERRQGGVLFLPYKAGEIAALRSVISAWMRIAIFEAMNRGEGNQRLWFIVDELDALGEIDGLKDPLARLRKFGGRCVLGFQSISQVSHTYGKGAADTMERDVGFAELKVGEAAAPVARSAEPAETEPVVKKAGRGRGARKSPPRDAGPGDAPRVR